MSLMERFPKGYLIEKSFIYEVENENIKDKFSYVAKGYFVADIYRMPAYMVEIKSETLPTLAEACCDAFLKLEQWKKEHEFSAIIR